MTDASHERSGRLTRRGFLERLGAAAIVAGLWSEAPAAAPKRRRLLCFTKSAGWEHTVVKRGADGAPSLVERTVTELGARHGFDVTCTKDGSVFTPEGLRAYDAFLFFTTGDLTTPGTDQQPPMPAGGKEALLAAVRAGKGFVGVHSATDTFHTKVESEAQAGLYVAHGAAADPYIAMIGGEFVAHGKIQPGRVRVVDSRFPGARALGATAVDRVGEWYSMKDFAPDMHVVMALDTAAMTGAPYQRGSYPVTWARRHGRGRVFYTALGHREEEWQEAELPALLVGALRWAFGDVKASVTPNLTAATPRAGELPPRA